MTDHRSPPPQPEECLCRPYPSSQKGGTIVVEAVMTLAQHEKMLGGGGYRLSGCPKCDGQLHVHDYRVRLLLGDSSWEVVVVRFLCSDCRATWQMLPAFVARCLWRSWSVVEAAVQRVETKPARDDDEEARPTVVPERTCRRWLGRLAASAAKLVVALAMGERPEYTELVEVVGHDGARRDLIREHTRQFRVPVGQRLLQLAELIHRLAPGVRLM